MGSVQMKSETTAADIQARFHDLKQAQPNIRARDAAGVLGVSEGELLASRVGNGATRLVDDFPAILQAVQPLGEVMALTRNESCVHERHGVYENSQFFSHGKSAMGLFVNPDIDLRLFMNHWQYGFAAVEDTRSGVRRSLQFFDGAGEAVHKIYITENSSESAYDELVAQYSHPEQSASIAVAPYPAKEPDRPDDEIDWPGLRTAWENLKDTHDFVPLMRKFKVGREQAFARIGSDFAYEVGNDAARAVLDAAQERRCEIMVFVGNRGCIQIHTGPVEKLMKAGPWYNILDPMFNLHLNEERIVRTWVTKKPTVDGIVTALEVFDEHGDAIITLFGKRKPGLAELELWREIIADIPARNADG